MKRASRFILEKGRLTVKNDEFEERNREYIERMGSDARLQQMTRDWFARASALEYSYHFKWLGLPIIQFPQDIVAMQEIIWDVQPDVIVETGIARGGSLILHASLLELIGGEGQVVGIDVDIREHNRQKIETHPMFRRITLLEGSSVDDAIVAEVFRMAADRRTLVILDSNHTHEHVLHEMQCYAPLVKQESYLVVLDTVIEDAPETVPADRPWGPGNNPKSAVHEFLNTTDRFEIDRSIQNKLQITVGPDGYLRCVKD